MGEEQGSKKTLQRLWIFAGASSGPSFWNRAMYLLDRWKKYSTARLDRPTTCSLVPVGQKRYRERKAADAVKV
ncbi:MAG: hypothetical protein NZM42_04845 [Gemmatales bacterium]|nr:hypothetical protein [Gemmatales bacterium]MDW8222572.1 hypothetical protein [Gemmatales bacterium]